MKSAGNAGRSIGMIMLLQLVAGPIVNFVLMGPVEATPGFLVSAAPHSTAVGAAALLAIAMALISLGMSVLIWPVLRLRSLSMALLFMALSIAGFTAETAEQSASLSMLSLSQKFAMAAPADTALFEQLSTVVGAAHKWAHYLNLIVGGMTMSVFYAALVRFALIPRVIAVFSLAAVAAMLWAMIAVVLGGSMNFVLLAPMALAQLATALWLLARGFSSSPASLAATA